MTLLAQIRCNPSACWAFETDWEADGGFRGTVSPPSPTQPSPGAGEGFPALLAHPCGCAVARRIIRH